MTPTQRTLAVLKEEGTPYWKVEHWNHHAKKRQDLFGFIDYLALYPREDGADEMLTDLIAAWKYAEGYGDINYFREERQRILDELTCKGIVGIQITSATHRADHYKKILSNEYAPQWLRSGGRIQLRTWRKYAERVDGKWWRERVDEITLEDFER